MSDKKSGRKPSFEKTTQPARKEDDAGGQAGHGKKRRWPARKRRAVMLAALCAVLVLAVVAAVPLAGWLTRQGVDMPVSSSVPQAGLPQQSSQPGLASSLSPGPIESELPQEPYPKFDFTEEEIAQLNAMLDEWAAQSTVIKQTEDDEGNPLPEPIEKVDGGNNVAVWVLDLESGAQYGYNAERQLYYASSMKAPYAAYLYTLAGAGVLDLNAELTVTAAHVAGYEENTGELKNMQMPVVLPVEEIIGYLIRYSDTVALKVLLAQWPASGFLDWAARLGVSDPSALNSVIYGRVSAADAGILMGAVYDVIQNGTYGGLLKEHMLGTRNTLVTSQWPVARKYGWDKYALHDFAVILGPRPVVMVIMTDKYGGSYSEMSMFGTVSETIQQMLDAHWAAYDAG